MNGALNKRMNTTLIENPVIQESLGVDGLARMLAVRLVHYMDDPDRIILALPKDRLGLASALSDRLRIPCETFIARPLRAPCECPCTIGALTETGVVYLDPEVISRQSWLHRELRAHIEREIQAQRIGIARQSAQLRTGRGLPDLTGRHVLFIDEGKTPSAVLFAVIEALRRLHAARIVAAIPMEINSLTPEIRHRVDEFLLIAS
jgi:putative phosphoribosyl transferase